MRTDVEFDDLLQPVGSRSDVGSCGSAGDSRTTGLLTPNCPRTGRTRHPLISHSPAPDDWQARRVSASRRQLDDAALLEQIVKIQAA